MELSIFQKRSFFVVFVPLLGRVQTYATSRGLAKWMENERFGEFQSDWKIKIGLEHKYEAKIFFNFH